jgi:hypothetical protein
MRLRHVRADALIFGSVNSVYATAAAATVNGQNLALLAAKFDLDGNRLWQTRIDTPLRGFFETGESTSIVETPDGKIFVAFHPRGATSNHFPTRVCELASETGTVVSCLDAPTNGRVSHLIAVGDRLHVWVNTTFDGGLALYELANGAWLPRSLFVPDAFAPTNTGIAGDGESRYHMTLRAGGEASTTMKYIEVQYAPSGFEFADGFE